MRYILAFLCLCIMGANPYMPGIRENYGRPYRPSALERYGLSPYSYGFQNPYNHHVLIVPVCPEPRPQPRRQRYNPYRFNWGRSTRR